MISWLKTYLPAIFIMTVVGIAGVSSEPCYDIKTHKEVPCVNKNDTNAMNDIVISTPILRASGLAFEFSKTEKPIAEYDLRKKRLTLDLLEIVQQNLCPSGWKKSNLSLRGYRSDLNEKINEVIGRYVGVEICPDNGLIRIKQ